VTPFITGFDRPTDVEPDPFHRLLIADFHAAAVYLLTPPGVTAVMPGEVAIAPPITRVRIERISPTPFSGAVEIQYRLSDPARVTLEVFDPAGRSIATVGAGPQGAGGHALRWDGRDAGGNPVPPGVYPIRIESPIGIAEGKLVRQR
jgi:hypothetical protein